MPVTCIPTPTEPTEQRRERPRCASDWRRKSTPLMEARETCSLRMPIPSTSIVRQHRPLPPPLPPSPRRTTSHERPVRSEEHTSELQSLMRNSYAVFCLKKKNAISTLYHLHNRNQTLSHFTHQCS